ncbi:MAG TPA: hypothetical protein VJ464_01810 [Blastocatellia bacterium]|nr:hypothetical protein [Blastocatellia bacterium]
MLISLLCGACIWYQLPWAALGALVSIRSLLLVISKSANSRWVKLITPPPLQSLRIKLVFLSFFLSTAVAGILAGQALAHFTILWAVFFDVVTYLVSMGIVLTLRPLEVDPEPSLSAGSPSIFQSLEEILSSSTISQYFLSVCLSQAIFQGAYSVLISYFPIKRFQIGIGGLGPFQLSASLGIIAGFLIIWLLPNLLTGGESRWPSRLVAAIGVGAASLIVSASATGYFTVLALFFVLHFAYECIWLSSSAEFFHLSPESVVGRYQFTLTSVASCLMAATTLAYAVTIEMFGLALGVGVVLFVGLLLWAAILTLRIKQVQLSVKGEKL